MEMGSELLNGIGNKLINKKYIILIKWYRCKID
jgi:hypothetical protein